jgi:hypothetical protein
MASTVRQKVFKTEIEEVAKLITSYHNVCLVGVRKIGTGTIIREVRDTAKKFFDIIIFDDGFLAFEDILTQIEKSSPKSKILIVIPHLSEKNDQFRENLQILLKNTTRKVSLLSAIDIRDFLALEKNFRVSIKPVRNIIKVKTRNLEQTKYILSEYLEDSDIEKIATDAFNISGGVPGLVKSCAQMYLKEGIIDVNKMLTDPIHSIILKDISQDFQILDYRQRSELGLTTNTTHKPNSIAIEMYLDNETNTNLNILDAVYRELKNNINNLVSNDQIDLIIERHGTFSLWNRYKIIERIRKQIPKNYSLKTLKAKGYILYVKKEL